MEETHWVRFSVLSHPQTFHSTNNIIKIYFRILVQSVESLERKEWAQGLFCWDRKHIFSLQANSHPEQYQRSTRKCSTGISMFALLGKYGVPIAIAWGVVKLAKFPRASSRLRRRKRLAVRSEEVGRFVPSMRQWFFHSDYKQEIWGNCNNKIMIWTSFFRFFVHRAA